jgi:hypothetical protein
VSLQTAAPAVPAPSAPPQPTKDRPLIEMLIGPQLAGDGVASIGVASEKAKLRCLLPNPGPNLLGEWPSPMSAQWTNGPYIQLLSDIKKSLH